MSQKKENEPRQLSPAEIEQAQELFRMFDKNRDNSITADELGTIMRALGGNPTDKDIEEMITELDTVNKDNKIEFEEFKNWYSKQTKPKQEDEKEEIRKAFEQFMNPDTGKIDKASLAKALTQVGMSQADVDQLFAEADTDKSGDIDFEEYAKALAG